MEAADRAFAAAYQRLAPMLERGSLDSRRRELLHGIRGRVVDVGAGVGANLPHLRPGVERVSLLEPSSAMAARLRGVVERTATPLPVEVIEAPGEAIPLRSASVDAVLCMLVLCTVQDPNRTLAEIRRVLRPDGRLVLIEHVRGVGMTARCQELVRPAWSFFGRGCDPTRDTAAALRAAGFDTSEIRPWRLSGAGPAAPAIEGVARPEPRSG